MQARSTIVNEAEKSDQTLIGAEKFIVPGVRGCFYIPEFVSLDDQLRIEHEVASLNTFHTLHGAKGPQVAAFDKFDACPQWIKALTERLKERGLLAEDPFQVSINLYRDDDACLLPHRDAAGKQVIILSLLSPVLLDLYFHENPPYLLHLFVDVMPDPSTGVLLQPGSLIVMKGDAFFKHLHGIRPLTEDTVSESMANFQLLNLPSGTVTKRGKRISIVFWT